MTKDEADQLWHELGELLAHSSLTESQCHEVKRAVIKYTTAHAQAAVDAFKADEWKFLDGPEFDYKKLTAEQEDLYAYAFNAGSKQAWEQAKAEHKSALADTLGMLEALAKRDEGDDSRREAMAQRDEPLMFIVSSRGLNPDHKLHEIFTYTLAPKLYGTMCGKWVEGRRYRDFPWNIPYCEDCLNVKF